jgi:hypothetical protein
MVQIKIDLENDKEFMSNVRGMVVEWIRSALADEDRAIDLLAKALSRYFEYKRSSVEQFTAHTVESLIASATDDTSSLTDETKAKNVVIQMLREAVTDVVAEKLKNVTITIE